MTNNKRRYYHYWSLCWTTTFFCMVSYGSIQSLVLIRGGATTVPVQEQDVGISVLHDYVATNCSRGREPSTRYYWSDLISDEIHVMDRIECLKYTNSNMSRYWETCTCVYQNHTTIIVYKGAFGFPETYQPITPVGNCFETAANTLECILEWRAQINRENNLQYKTVYCEWYNPNGSCDDSPSLLRKWSLIGIIMTIISISLCCGSCYGSKHSEQTLQKTHPDPLSSINDGSETLLPVYPIAYATVTDSTTTTTTESAS